MVLIVFYLLELGFQSMFLKPPTFTVSRYKDTYTSNDIELLNTSFSSQMISAKIMVVAENAIM